MDMKPVKNTASSQGGMRDIWAVRCDDLQCLRAAGTWARESGLVAEPLDHADNAGSATKTSSRFAYEGVRAGLCVPHPPPHPHQHDRIYTEPYQRHRFRHVLYCAKRKGDAVDLSMVSIAKETLGFRRALSAMSLRAVYLAHRSQCYAAPDMFHLVLAMVDWLQWHTRLMEVGHFWE